MRKLKKTFSEQILFTSVHHSVRSFFLANLIELFQSNRTDVSRRPPVSRVELLAGLIKLVAFPLLELACWSDKTGEGGELLSKISPNKKKKKMKKGDNILSELIRACSTQSFAEYSLM